MKQQLINAKPVLKLVSMSFALFLCGQANAQYSKLIQSPEAANLSARALKETKIRVNAENLFSQDVNYESYLQKTKTKYKWEVNNQPSFKEYYIDIDCGHSKPIEAVTGSILVSNKSANFGNATELRVMVPYGVKQETGVFIEFCRTDKKEAHIYSSCQDDYSFVANFSSCDKQNEFCTARLNIQEESVKGKKLQALLSDNDMIVVAYDGKNGLSRCGMPYQGIKNVIH